MAKRGQTHVWFGMKLTPAQKRKIERLAERKGTTQKDAVMRLVDEAFEPVPFKARRGSILERIEELVGSIEGPRDLSTSAPCPVLRQC
jgi:hypothetical protein